MPMVPAGYVVVRRLPSRSRAIYEAVGARGERVALNVALAPRLEGDEPACPRGWRAEGGVERIVDVVRRLEHPGIVRLVAEHLGEEYPAFAVGWCEGRRLDEVVVEGMG